MTVISDQLYQSQNSKILWVEQSRTTPDPEVVIIVLEGCAILWTIH